MNMKKTALASAIALALISTSGARVWAVTTTVGGAVIPDRDEIAAGGIVNLALLGLDAKGAVDKQGEQGGSKIMVTLKSNQCEIVGGSSSLTGEPTTTPDSNRLGEGQFAASTRYVTLDQGNGKVFLQCPPSARGTETIEVSFQEKIPMGSGFEFKNITGPMTKEITITPPVTDPGGLTIKSFKPEPTDPRGKMDCTPSGTMGDTCTNPDDGIWGEMTAGMAGGQIEVWAQNQQAASDITVMLTHTTEMPKLEHTYKAEMVQGRAMVTLDSAITKAGEYYIEATMKGFDGNSVRLVFADKLKVWATGIPAGLKLWSAKNRLAKADFTAFPFPDNQVAQGATVQAQLLDQFGNPTTPCAPVKDKVTNITTCTMAPMDINLSIQDAKGVASNSALNLFIPAGSPDGKAIAKMNDLILGNQKDELIIATAPVTTGTVPVTTPVATTPVAATTSLVATASDASGKPIGSIAASSPLEIMVVPTSLGVTVQPTFLEDHLAGEEFEAIVVRVLNNKGQLHVDANNNPIRPQGAIVIKNLYTGEESSAYPDSNNIVRALFKKATDGHGEYLVYDQAGNYGQIWIEAGAIGPAAATQAEFHNAHGQVLTDVPPTPITPEKTYYTLLPEISFKLMDEYGNEQTPVGPATTGFVFAESSNGQVLYNTREGTHGVPGRLEFFDDSGIPSLVAIRYDATGANQFAGQDAISLNFTKPGKKNLTLTTTIPAYQGLVKIETYLDEDTIPVNSEVALTVETLDDKGNLFVEPNPAEPTNVKLTVNGQTGDNVTPALNEVKWIEKQLTDIECQTVGGLFTNGMCTTMQALTEQQCQLIKGTLMNSRCMQMTTMPVVSGQTLNFSETGGRKVFIASAGPNEGQFSLTFDALGTPTTPLSGQVTTTRTVKVGQTVPDCVKDPTTCQNEQACENTQSIWSENQCYLGDEVVSADTTNPSYPDPQDEGDAGFKGGIRNLTKKGETFDPKPTQPVTLGDKVAVACNIKVDEEHQGKPADILVAAVHLPVIGKDPVYPKGYEWYMVRHCREVQGENSPCPSIGWIPDVLPSDAQGNPYLPALEPLESVANLPKYYTVRAYVGNIPYIGEYQAYCGYMITEGKDKGKIIYNGDPIEFNVEENK